MAGRTRWWWRLPLVCGINVVGIVVMTEVLWVMTSGEPYMSRLVQPKPSLFQFKQNGIALAIIATSVPTALGWLLNFWLMRHRFRHSLTAGIQKVWNALHIWRFGWWWRAAATVSVVFILAVAYASVSYTSPIAHATGTLANAWLTAPAANAPAGTALPAWRSALLSAQTSSGVRPLVERGYEIVLIVLGALSALLVFRVLCVRGAPRDGLLRCVRCDHILHGLTEPRCPECGESI